MHKANKIQAEIVDIETKGGKLQVKFVYDANGYNNVSLIGPAKQVFKGEIEW